MHKTIDEICMKIINAGPEPNKKLKLRGCSICPTKSTKGLFQFPTNRDVRKKWLDFCGDLAPVNLNNKRVCYKHFGHKDFLPLNTDDRIAVWNDAVPKIFNGVYRKSTAMVNNVQNLIRITPLQGQAMPLQTQAMPLPTQLIPLQTQGIPMEAQTMPIQAPIMPIPPDKLNTLFPTTSTQLASTQLVSK